MGMDLRAFRPDPRLYQNAVLAALLVYGVMRLDFEIAPARALAILATALLTQLVCTRLAGLPAFDPRSALISGLSLCLLLRTNSAPLALAAPVIAVASKFALRWRGKHLFNPTNIALVILLVLGARVWVSPGQWGNTTWLAFLFACLGGIVVQRAARADVTLSFMLAWVVLLFGRALVLGQPVATPLHQLQSGAFLLFSFFMISDPRTTPDSRAGRVLFAVLVAAGAAFVQFILYRTNGLLWSLAACSLLVPLIDGLLPGPRHAWTPSPVHSLSLPKGDSHGSLVPVPCSDPGRDPRGAVLGAGRV
jgi:Na+-translocating ferredoxin:NAD+ oxidoreductase RnfD subunit